MRRVLYFSNSQGRGRPACTSLPRGVTIFEMLLVLALLVAMAALAWPAIENSFVQARLRAAADKIRSQWSEARLEAMRSGIVQEFRHQDEGNTYQFRSWSSLTTPTEQASSTSGSDEEAPLSPMGAENQLPEGITFATGSLASDTRVLTTAAASGANADIEGLYSAPILFYPDGTTVDATIYLKTEQGLYLRIVLRGLTGLSRVSDPLTVEEL